MKTKKIDYYSKHLKIKNAYFSIRFRKSFKSFFWLFKLTK